jgi:hypothetical protein
LDFPLASLGGGKSRLGGVDPQLQRLLKDAALKFLHQLKDRQLAVLDQPALLGRVHRVHHLRQGLLHLHADFRRQLITIDLNQPFHGFSFSGISVPETSFYHPPGKMGAPFSPSVGPQS